MCGGSVPRGRVSGAKALVSNQELEDPPNNHGESLRGGYFMGWDGVKQEG